MGIFEPVSAPNRMLLRRNCNSMKDSTDSDPATSNTSDSTWNFYDKDNVLEASAASGASPKDVGPSAQSKQ